MGSSGFPFPSIFNGEVQRTEDEASPPIVRADSLCSSVLFSPGNDGLYSPLAGTPSRGREQEILPSVFSPIATETDDSQMSAFGQSALPRSIAAIPSNPSLPTPPHEKRPGLRLPPFSELGIDSYHRRDPNADTVEALPVDMAMVTPPVDTSDRVWNSSLADLSLGGGGAPAIPERGIPAETPGESAQSQSSPLVPTSTGESSEFLRDAMKKIFDTLDGQDPHPNSIRVLSHALPSPTVPGHLFPQVLESVKNRNTSSPLVWISHLHAVPYRFNVSDLPTSPLSTPGQPLGTSDGTGEDYFTTKTFESAVVALDYSSFSEGLSVTPADTPPRSSLQQELAAPSSLNLIVVERYIPPISTKELTNLFSLTNPSLLSDRLFELVPGNGCVVFIYPTRTGAHTFCDKLLGPIIDPLLRGLAVVTGFSADLSKAIGTMTAVPKMLEFEGLKFHMNELCEEVHRTASSSPVRQRLCGGSDRFSVIYAEKKEISLSRAVWSEWWVKQEKVRIRRAVSQYFRSGSRVASESESYLTQEIFNGIAKKPYPPGSEPTADTKVEVGIFVVSRERQQQ